MGMNPEQADYLRVLRELAEGLKREIQDQYVAAATHAAEQEFHRCLEVAESCDIEATPEFVWGMTVGTYSFINVLRGLLMDLPGHYEDVVPRMVSLAFTLDVLVNRLEHAQ